MLVDIINKTPSVELSQLSEGDFFIWDDHLYQYHSAKKYIGNILVKAYDFNLNMYGSLTNNTVVRVVKFEQIKLTVEL